MGDLESLLVVLAAIYLAECIVWVRRGSVVFINWWGLPNTPWRLHHPGSTLGNQHGAVLFANPLPPLGAVCFGQQPLASLSPQGVLAWSDACLNPTWRPVNSGRFISFAGLKSIERDGRKVLVDGELFLKTVSPFVARRLVRTLRELKAAPEQNRAALIEEALERSLGEKAIRDRLEEFQKRARVLRLVANSLFCFLYILAPLLVWRWGFYATIWPLAAGFLGHTVSLAILFRRAHEHLYPGAHEECFTPFLTMLLAPPSDIRATDELSRQVFDDNHALAVAKVLLSQHPFHSFARRVFLDLHHPMFPPCPSGDPAAVQTEQEFRERLRAVVERFLERCGVDVAKLVRPLPPTEPSHRAFCARCDAQFINREGTCADCGGRPLATWPPEPSAVPATRSS